MHIGAYELEAPLINGGGLVKSVEDVRQMARTAVGAVLVGSFTLEPRIGNSPDGERVYFHDLETGITYNALGMPNKGMAYIENSIKEMADIAHDHGKPLILNFAPVTSNPLWEVQEMGRMLARSGVTGIDGIELNASCPNVVTGNGARHEPLSHHPSLLGEVLAGLVEISKQEVPLGDIMTRIAPFRQKSDAHPLAKAIQDAYINFLTGFNTLTGGRPLKPDGSFMLQVPGGVGGQSGPGMRIIAEEQTKWLMEAREAAQADFEVIGSNGVATGEAMKQRLDLGAAAVSATTIFWEAKSWGDAADRILSEFSELSE